MVREASPRAFGTTRLANVSASFWTRTASCWAAFTSKKACFDIRGGLHGLHLHDVDENTGAIGVQRLLHDLPHFLRHAGLLGRQYGLDVPAADHLAHGAFRHGLDGAFGILKVEHEILRAGGIHLPHGIEIDVDDILVAGQHEAFLDHVAGALLGVGGGAIADFDPLLLGDVRLDHASDRVRQVVAKALTGGAGVFAEDHIDADLARPHRIEPCQKPDDDGAKKKRDQALCRPSSRRA